ncbi:MAG: DUF423 domain-containing protein [Alphaproteobacteria bacterium]|nr:DUF423 domain-containing protein [Alphaproteobacteria bacterium]
MIPAWLLVAAVVGFLSVSAGAAATHLAAGEQAAGLLRSGALYGMVHAAALLAVAAMAQAGRRSGLPLTIAGWSFAIGALLFSISLFGLALTASEWLGMITPFGGVGLLIGWASLAVHALCRANI